MDTENCKSDEVYSVLYERIKKDYYKNGDRIVIRQTAKELGVSPIPVREAIKRLEMEGYVTTKQYSGPIVCFPDDSQFGDYLELVSVVEGYAARLLAPIISKATIEQLRSKYSQMEDALYNLDIKLYSILQEDFHRIITDACPNIYIQKEAARIFDRMQMLRPNAFHRGYSLALRQMQKDNLYLLQLFEEKEDPQIIEAHVRSLRQPAIDSLKRKQ